MLFVHQNWPLNPENMASALALSRQLHYPRLGDILRRTAVALVLVCGFVAIVGGIDSACSLLLRVYEKRLA